jgi:hypothetical protein
MKLKQAVLPGSTKFFIPKLSLGNSNVQVTTTYQPFALEEAKKALNFIFSSLRTLAKKTHGLLKEVVQGAGDFATDRVAPSIGSARKGLSKIGSTFRYNFPKRRFLRILFIALVLLGIFSAARAVINLRRAASESKQQILGAKASLSLNKEITFPLRNDKGEEVSSISYVVEKAELMDEILVRGEKATAVSGRTFLILTIKVKNDFDKSIEINTKDYVRLKVTGSEELLAPDIHSDPVTVQAISTKYTRLGFPINDSDRQVTLQLGEINGPKESIEVRF